MDDCEADVDDNLQLAHAAHDFFLRVLLWHKTFTSAGNKLFALSFLREKFDTDLDADFEGSQHFWELLLKAVRTMVKERGLSHPILVFSYRNF